jgi:outer membrane protein TolC
MALIVPSRAGAQAPVSSDTLRESFTLGEAVDRAFATHPSVAAALADREQAAAQVGVSRSRYFPSLRTDGSVTRFQEPMIVTPLHNLHIVRAPPEFDQTLIQGDVSLDWTLFDGGLRGADVRRASAERDASGAALASARLDLAENVAESYLRALTLRDVLQATDLRITALTGERDRAQRFLDSGRAARIELLRAEAALSQAAADRVSVAQDLEVAIADLGRLTSLPPGELPASALAGVSFVPTDETPDRATLAAAVVTGSPEVDRARRLALAAEAGRSAARAAWFPRLDAAAGYIERGSSEGDFTGEWQAGLQLGYPLFTGGSRSSEVAGADAAARAARERVREVELAAQGNLDRALAALAQQDARIVALTAAVAQSEEVVRIERLALDAGRAVQTDYLREEATLLAARAELIRARNDEILARVRVARATGELSPDWIAGHLETSP